MIWAVVVDGYTADGTHVSDWDVTPGERVRVVGFTNSRGQLDAIIVSGGQFKTIPAWMLEPEPELVSA